VFPDGGSLIRLVGAVLLEPSNEWQGARRDVSLEAMAKAMGPPPLLVAEPLAFRLAPVH
jgi:hypothetical protein